MKISKKRAELLKKIDRNKAYSVEEAVALVKENAPAKFVETVEIHVRLNVDPRHADQQVRSTMVLPHGTGKTKRVMVLTSDKIAEAEAAGADYVGGAELAQKIAGGWFDYDAVIATPDMMKLMGPLGKVLGPRGLMPSAKAGTVTANVAEAVKEIKGGRVEFRVDKFGITHNSVGLVSFTVEQLIENVKAYQSAVVRARPAAVKGAYIKSMTLSSTMGLGLRIDPNI